MVNVYPPIVCKPCASAKNSEGPTPLREYCIEGCNITSLNKLLIDAKYVVGVESENLNSAKHGPPLATKWRDVTNEAFLGDEVGVLGVQQNVTYARDLQLCLQLTAEKLVI